MSERELILDRIREALRFPAPLPGHGLNGPHASVAPSEIDPRPWLPPAPGNFEERLALFRKNAIALKAEFQVVQNLHQAATLARDLRDSEGWKKVGTHAGTLTDAICKELAVSLSRTDAAYDVRELEACSAGITECDALVAQTGSVLVTSRSAGGRALSVLPPHHVVLARPQQLLADLPEAFALLKRKYAPDYPSFVSFITGPSRTGDIERILVLGAHGPKKLTIILLHEM